jgi:hypothetical protein
MKGEGRGAKFILNSFFAPQIEGTWRGHEASYLATISIIFRYLSSYYFLK